MPRPKQPSSANNNSPSSPVTCTIQQLRFSVAIDAVDSQESGCNNNHENYDLQHSNGIENECQDSMSSSQCSKTIILKELIKTETLYLNYFEILKEKIIQSLARCNILTPEEVERMFCLSQLTILFKVNTELLNQFKQVEQHLQQSSSSSSPTLTLPSGSSPRAKHSLGQTFFRLSPFLKNYVQYSHMLEPCLIQFRNRKLKDKSFKAIVKKLQRFCTKLLLDALGEDEEMFSNSLQFSPCNEFEIIQAMKMPLRRIVYYRDVLTQLLKLTPMTNDEYSPLSESFKLIEIVSQSFEQQITELDNKDKFYEINKKVLKQSENGDIISIAKPNRLFIYENEMYVTTTKNLATRHPEKRRKSSKISPTGLDIDAINRNETNAKFFQDPSYHCVGFLFNDMIMICSTHFSTPQTPRTGLRETATKKKRIREIDALLGKKSMRYKYHISLESFEESPSIWIRKIISDHDHAFSHMFQLVTKDVIYTFKMRNEETKTRWINAIQSAIEKNRQVLEKVTNNNRQVLSRGYLDIPEAWVLPSILRIQSLARKYLACLKTQRIKKKSRKNPKTKLDHVIQKVSQLDNILLQNQSFVESYPKKQASAVTILQNYEEDINENYIEDEKEDSEKEQVSLSTTLVTSSMSPISQPTRKSTMTPRGTPSTPVLLNSNSPREFESQDNDFTVKNHSNSTNSVEFQQHQQQPMDEMKSVEMHDSLVSQQPSLENSQTIENSNIMSSNKNQTSNIINSEMYSKEIVYEDEFENEYIVRIGDEIVYEDEHGDQISEIVTPEKFLEMLENAKREQQPMQTMQNREQEQINKNEISKSTMDEERNDTTTNQLDKKITTCEIIEEETEQREDHQNSHQMNSQVETMRENHDSSQTSTDIDHYVRIDKIDESDRKNSSSSLISTTHTLSQEEVPSSNNNNNSTTVSSSQPLDQQDTNMDWNNMTSNDLISNRLSTESNKSTTSSTFRTSTSNSGSDISKKIIAPWQEELLSKYKNDGKFKFVTQTAEQKLTTTTSQPSTLEDLSVPPQQGLPPTDRMAIISPVHHRESIRVSADFHNFLNKFKTIEQKTKKEEQQLFSPRGTHMANSTKSDQQQH